MTTSTTAPGPSARTTHQTPDGVGGGGVKGHCKDVVEPLRGGLGLSFYNDMRAANAPVGSDEMMTTKEAQIR